MVVTVHPGGGQASGLVVGEDPRAHGHVEPGAGADERHQIDDAPQRPLVGSAHGEHDAELRRSESRRLFGRGQHLVRLEERRGLDGRVEA